MLRCPIGEDFSWFFDFVLLMYVIRLMFDVLGGSLYKDFGEDRGSWTHVGSILTRKLVWIMQIIVKKIFHARQGRDPIDLRARQITGWGPKVNHSESGGRRGNK